jgi:1-deoxyxylulose-5-phosphate synthase
MGDFDRRGFLGTSAGIAAGLAAMGHSGQTANAKTEPAVGAIPRPPQIELGNTGVKMSRLGQGTGVHGGSRQSDQTRMGFDKLVDLFHHAYDRGITFYDLADLYGSHVYFREALREIPRDKISILTKVWWRYDGPEDNTSADHRRQAARATLERFRHELTTDYIDIVLLHCLQDPAWTGKMQPYMDELDNAKQAGRVKAVGVSCHDFGALKAAATNDWVDVILARINPEGVMMDASPAEVIDVLSQAKASGKAIIGMKIFGEGRLVDQRDRCIEYAQNHEFMDAMTIGFHKPEQIDEVLQLMAKFPAVNA